MSEATLHLDGERPAVRLERVLAEPPSAVWPALTKRERLRAWFPCDVEVAGGEWRDGAAITFSFPPEVIQLTLTGTVLAVDEPTTLAFAWGDDVLRFALSPEGRGTRLVLVDELPAELAACNAAGWELCLDRLAGLEPAADAWRTCFERYVAAFEPVIGAQAGPPDGYKG